MKPIIETKTTLTSDIESVRFGLSRNAEDEAQIMELLRTGMYKDKVLAVLREYGANAWDANKVAALAEGREPSPIQIHVPTAADPVLRIRDFGAGLTKEQVLTVFSQYGASSKRDSNSVVGSFGIGAKAGFAYSDSFTVTSVVAAHAYDLVVAGALPRTRLTYVAQLDESGFGQMSLLDESPTSEPTGVEISVAVKHKDLYEFQQKAERLYQHMEPRPLINITLPTPPADRTVLKNGTIVDEGAWSSKWFVVMGCVPYRLDLEELDQTKLAKCLMKLSGQVNVEIGEIAVSASREDVRYTDRTKAFLVQKLNDLVDEYVFDALKALEGDAMSGWEKRTRVLVLDEMGLPLPEEWADYAFKHVTLKYEPLTAGFTLTQNNAVCSKVTVTGRTRMIIRDTQNSLAHYPYLKDTDYVVKGEGTPEEIRASLEIALKASGLDGVPISMLSDEYYCPPKSKAKKAHNPKHKARMFVLKPGFSSATRSDCWDVVDREPQDDDVYVIIEGFESSKLNIYAEVREVLAVAEAVGETVPPIYGYKTSQAKPVDMGKVRGTDLVTWIAQWYLSLKDKYMPLMQEYRWHALQAAAAWGDGKDRLFAALGANHPICALVARKDAADPSSAKVASLAHRYLPEAISDANMALMEVYAAYPLLRNELRELWRHSSWNGPDQREHWIDYVKLVDERAARQSGLDTNADEHY